MTPLDLNLIRIFVTIFETQSVTAAAERLDLTQPTVSYSLGKLRDKFSDQLFVRAKRRLKPTTLAEALYPNFRDALSLVTSAVDETYRFDPKTAYRVFNLAMSDIGSMYFLPLLEMELRRSAPNISLDVRQVAVSDLVEQLAARKVDVALGNLPSLFGQARSLPLFREHYMCLVGWDYANRIRKVTLDVFLASRHVVVSSPYSDHQLAEDALTNLGISRKVVIRTPYYTALPRLIASSDLVVILPSRVAAVFALQSNLVALPVPVELPEFDVKLHWHPRHETNPALMWLIERTEVILREGTDRRG